MHLLETVLFYDTVTWLLYSILNFCHIKNKLKKYRKWCILCILYKAADTRNSAFKSITEKKLFAKVFGLG